MSARAAAGRAFAALGFMVLGAGAVMLLPDDRPPQVAARVAAPGGVDVGFSQDMIVHHQQAVTMAQAVRGRTGPSVAGLASAIELNQIKEIGQMQGWLSLWNAPQVPSGPPMAWMATDRPGRPGGSGHAGHGATGHGGDGHRATGGAMPGMASQQELDGLGRAKGRDLDVRFLQLMIRHHEGGLVMTAAAARDATHPQVRGLATLMAAEQRKEIGVMSGLLAALGGHPVR
ncbi:DUF305 domain-containing protein [Spirillospora sp. CA-255316]